MYKKPRRWIYIRICIILCSLFYRTLIQNRVLLFCDRAAPVCRVWIYWHHLGERERWPFCPYPRQTWLVFEYYEARHKLWALLICQIFFSLLAVIYLRRLLFPLDLVDAMHQILAQHGWQHYRCSLGKFFFITLILCIFMLLRTLYYHYL